MYHKLNEFRYNAKNGKNYIIYFLKFWKGEDYFVKYQIRTQEKDFFWFGRISLERVLMDLKLDEKEIKKLSELELDIKIEEHLRNLFIAVMIKGLDNGYEEPDTEFVFYKEPFVFKRKWEGK
uniref:Uncharacterized protein n=1 Tax=candidate division WOR-3 bacterium TaxID=2052148 RepID=A0A7C4Y9F6_UNCW3